MPTVAPTNYPTTYPTKVTATPTFAPITLYSSLVIVNSSLAKLDEQYSQALSSTLAICLDIKESDVVITSSRSPNRRLLDLFVILTDVVATFTYRGTDKKSLSLGSKFNRTEIYAALQERLEVYILSGNATQQFRQELTLLGVDFYPHIAIVAVRDDINTQTTTSVPSSAVVNWVTIVQAVAGFVFLVCCCVFFYYFFYFRHKHAKGSKGDKDGDLDLSSLYENTKSSDKASAIEDGGESDVLKAVYNDFLQGHNYFTAVSNSCGFPDRGSGDGTPPRPRSTVLDNLDFNLMDIDQYDDVDDTKSATQSLEEGMSTISTTSRHESDLVGFEDCLERVDHDRIGEKRHTSGEGEGEENDRDSSHDFNASSDAPSHATSSKSDDLVCGYDVYDLPRAPSDLDLYSQAAQSETDDKSITPEEVDPESSKLHSLRPLPQHTSVVESSFVNPLRSIGSGSVNTASRSQELSLAKPRGLFPEQPYMSSSTSIGGSSLKSRRPYMNNDQANPLMGGSRTNNQITSSIKFRATKLIFESLINENSKSSIHQSPGSPESTRTIRRQASMQSPYCNSPKFMRAQMRRTSTNDSTRTEDFASISIGSISREQGLSTGLSNECNDRSLTPRVISIDMSNSVTDI
jgi:hypothetical protein